MLRKLQSEMMSCQIAVLLGVMWSGTLKKTLNLELGSRVVLCLLSDSLFPDLPLLPTV